MSQTKTNNISYKDDPYIIDNYSLFTIENEEKTKQYKESNLPKNKDSMHISF